MLNVRMFMGQSLSRRRRGHRQIASFLFGAVPSSNRGVLAGPTPSAQTASGPEPIDQAALPSLVDTTIKELLIPRRHGSLAYTSSDFSTASGTTQLNITNPPSADTYFRIASSTKTMTAAVIMSWHRKANSVSTMRHPSMSRACQTATPSTPRVYYSLATRWISCFIEEGEGVCFGSAHPRAARDLGILLVRSAFTHKLQAI